MGRDGDLADAEEGMGEGFFGGLTIAGADGDGVVRGRDEMDAAADLFAEVQGDGGRGHPAVWRTGVKLKLAGGWRCSLAS